MQVDRTDDETWRVIAADGEVLASGLSNAEAWRFSDSSDETAADDAHCRPGSIPCAANYGPGALGRKSVQNDRNHVATFLWVGVVAVITLLHCSSARADARVILLRGWFGVFSTGLDEIADALKTKGIRAEVAGHLYWRTAIDDILRERAEGKTDALVLVGHSQGANNVIDMARMLEAKNVPVALVVTLAPYKQEPIPSNVMRAINFYQSTGWGAPITAGTGFRGRLSNIDVTEDSTVSHINIDKSTRVQAEIARDVEAIAKAN